MTGPQRTTRPPVPRGPRSSRPGANNIPRGPVTRGPKLGPARDDGPQRIAKLLARVGIASRRAIERMIADGRVAINGEVLKTPATVLENLAGVTVDGKQVAKPEAARLFRFYKPPSCLTAEFDPKGRPTIYD